MWLGSCASALLPGALARRDITKSLILRLWEAKGSGILGLGKFPAKLGASRGRLQASRRFTADLSRSTSIEVIDWLPFQSWKNVDG